ncbi:MAG: bifunctional YncE family protein/alkaline phosphatase family protein [Armatimonadetes bacterium]|nr:bifunctional YncE family protein/alkaline phosphatase family protein [Armatimonadota bacterium]
MLATLATVACLGLSPVAVRRVGRFGNAAFLPSGHRAEGAGQFLEFGGRPVDAVVSADGKTLFIKDMSVVRAVDVATWTETGHSPLDGGASLSGMALSPDGKQLAVSNAGQSVVLFTATAQPQVIKKIDVQPEQPGGKPYPVGVMFSASGESLFVAASGENRVVEMDLATGKTLRSVPVGVAPYGLARLGGKVFVSEMGGPRAAPADATATSAGTPTVVDYRGVAKAGSVSAIDLASFKVSRQVVCGRQPSAVVADPRRNRVYVAVTNDDCVLELDGNGARVATIAVRPTLGLPFGSMPDALALAPDGKHLVVALAGNNAMAVVELDQDRQVSGLVPTDWYPTAVVATETDILVVNNKGLGARSRSREAAQGWNSHDGQGTLRKVSWGECLERGAELTASARANALTSEIEAALAAKPRPNARPVPVPERVGEPSLIKHVVYVIKENRTYDQVFGDISRGAGDARLCTFGRQITPNQHKLADEFVLLDNYYCNGVLSADGHSYATEGNLTPYLNRAFGGFTRSYTFGDDPITFSSSGFVWDALLDKGLRFRNFGEFHYTEPVEKLSGRQIWDRYKAGKTIEWTQSVGVERVRKHSNVEAPGWNMNIPDQLRMDVFLREFATYTKAGSMPEFIVIYLPQDHTGGAVSARSNVADNDLAVGRLVDALSHSQFWKDTAVFINEDDPQNGFDHIDGHRSTCLVVSPYTRRGGRVISDFFNQGSVLHTIHRIFGLPPMNQSDAASPVMASCFVNKPDYTPYTLTPNRVPLDEFPKASASAQSAYQKEILALVAGIDLTEREVQTPAQMNALNRKIWHEAKGWATPYPAEFAGAHGKGLAGRGLTLAGGVEDDD